MAFMNGNRMMNANYYDVTGPIERGIGEKSATVGFENVAGSNAYKISSITANSRIMTLSSVEGLEIGFECSCVYDRNHDLFGKIVSIDSANKRVTFDKLPSDTFRSGDTNVLWVPEHPEIGDGETVVGAVAFAAGGGNKANQDASISLGYDNISGGRFSITAGRGNFAGYNGVALGAENKLTKETAVGIGQGNIITNQIGVGIGRKNQVSGQYGVGIGNECVVKPQAGIAVGNNATVEEGGVIALGKLATSNNDTKIAINNNVGEYYFEVGSNDGNKANAQNYIGLDPARINLGVGNAMPKNTGSSRYNVVIGSYNDYKGSGSILIGHKNKANESAVYGLAIGENLTLQNEHDIVIGNNAQASNKHNVSIGYKTNTSGLGATAIGWENHATGLFATAFGKTNLASGQSQFVVGEANARDDNALFIVGNGNSNQATIGSFDNSPGRSNAIVVRKSGEVLGGKATTKDSSDLVLVTKGYLDSLIASLQEQIDKLK